MLAKDQHNEICGPYPLQACDLGRVGLRPKIFRHDSFVTQRSNGRAGGFAKWLESADQGADKNLHLVVNLVVVATGKRKSAPAYSAGSDESHGECRRCQTSSRQRLGSAASWLGAKTMPRGRACRRAASRS